jgi:prepilin-type N-terminal cleavage/methylation domain-containing protein/prepilin-type processing-associated H-X9-DG protein
MQTNILKKSPFSLIELMVVIAIIAILASFLLPGLGRARKSARLAVCASQQRQVGAAIHMFSEDNLKKLPHGANNANAKAGTWEIRVAPYMGINYAQSYIDDALSHTGNAEKLAPIDNPLLRCPEDSRVVTNGGFLRTYSINSYVRWYPHLLSQNPGNGVFSRTASKSLKTSFLSGDSLLLLENQTSKTTAHLHQGCAWDSALGTDDNVTNLQLPHQNGEKGNFLYTDGHVSVQTRNTLEINNYKALRTNP